MALRGSLRRGSLLKWFGSSHWDAVDTSFLLQVVATLCEKLAKMTSSTSMRSQTYFMYFGALVWDGADWEALP